MHHTPINAPPLPMKLITQRSNMPPIDTEGTLEAAAQQLAKSNRGIIAMRCTLEMLQQGTLALDGQNKAALLKLLIGAFTTHPGTTLNLLRQYSDVI